MKNLLVIIIGLFSLFFLTHIVFAQTIQPGTPSATTSISSQITFPIAELGNCATATDCKIYCDDPTHIDACIAYAKARGFYHQSSLDSQQDAILADAKATLGCDSVDACKTFCADSQHADTCTAFAQKHNLKGGKGSADNATLANAKAAFGCDSIDSCRAFCQLPENQAKCADFAKANGLKGGNQTMGPGGCTSQASCRVFCSDPNNFQICHRFSENTTSSASGHNAFTGPGGCTTEDSCRAFCDKNPTVCHRTIPPLPPLTGTTFPTGFDRQVDKCMNSPQLCVTGTPNPSTPPISPFISPQPTQFQNQTTNISSFCASRGCSFNGTNCVCPTPPQTTGSQTGSFGPPPTLSTVTTTIAPSPTQTSSTSSTSVRGVSTERNLFQWFVDQLFHLH